ncbi:MAG: hypothetical protein GXY83_21555 [Rhodopirellula sp.]|nr:hypothetical protein [Rhodopirellula sp.]
MPLVLRGNPEAVAASAALPELQCYRLGQPPDDSAFSSDFQHQSRHPSSVPFCPPFYTNNRKALLTQPAYQKSKICSAPHLHLGSTSDAALQAIGAVCLMRKPPFRPNSGRFGTFTRP